MNPETEPVRSNIDQAPKQAVYQTFYAPEQYRRGVYLPQTDGSLADEHGRAPEPYVLDEQNEWMHCVGISDAAVLRHLLASYGIHELVVEDILSPKQRPKIEDYGDYLFIALRASQYSGGKLHSDPVYLIVGHDFILSFQSKPLGLFSDLHRRFAENKSDLRRRSIEFLAYHFIDRIVDDYLHTLDVYQEKVEQLDRLLFKGNGSDETLLGRIHKLKRDAVKLQRNIMPMREIAGQLLRGRFEVFSGETQLYMRDVYDHILQLTDTLDASRDTVVSMMDVQLSFQSNRLNNQMRALTLITILFMPLTLIAGIYGMNFDYMPELKWKYGYFGVLGAMLLIVAGLLLYFRKRKWL